MSSPQRHPPPSPAQGTQHHAVPSPAEGLERGNPAHHLRQQSALRQYGAVPVPYLALRNPTVVFREGRKRQRDTEARGLLTQDTTRPLKQGSLALSSEISSFTTLQRREEAVRAGSRISEEKEAFPGGCLHPATGSSGLGMGQGEDRQLPPAASYAHSCDGQGGRGKTRAEQALPCAPSCFAPRFTF